MIYNLSSPLQAKNAEARLQLLKEREAVVEITEKKGRRTNSQNAYLHVLLAYLATQIGEREEYVKLYYFKALCNPSLFLYDVEDKYMGRIQAIRSTAELTTAEMTTAIERLRHWAIQTIGVYLPEPNEEDLLHEMGIEIERNKHFI